MKKTLGIYIHIPFCVQKCYYCDFCSAPANERTKSDYVSALIKSIESASVHFDDRLVDSVFLGGGTPTCLSSEVLSKILETVKNSYTVSRDAEISIECNPATASFDDFKVLVAAGFNRLSMGVQSVHNQELKVLGRVHTFEEFEKTFSDARTAGFGNINLDLMYGIPLQTEESFRQTLNTVISYRPEHISAYSLKVEPGTLFFKNKDKLLLPDEDSEYNMYKMAVSILGNSGYGHYEISNYALEGMESRHNLKYWNCDDYVGFGISAHSCLGRNRYAAISDLQKYIGGKSEHFEIIESLSEAEFAEEYIMMRLRLKSGLSTKEYYRIFGHKFPSRYLDRMSPFIKSGHIIYSDERYYLSDDGMYLSNYILSDILDLE